MKVLIGVSSLAIIAGIVILIILNTGTSKKTKADTTTLTAPSSNNAYFDASNGSYIDFGRGSQLNCLQDLPNSKKMTITLWVRWTDFNVSGVGSSANLISLVDSSGSGDNGVFWVQHNAQNTKFEFVVKNANGRKIVQSTTSPVAGTWYHLACVYDGTPGVKEMYIYVNGVLEATTTNTTGQISSISSKAKLNMGRWCNPQDNFRHFNGNLDEVSIWNIALTHAQISDIMNNPVSVMGSSFDASGLLDYWNFDDKTANDLSPCKNNGVVGSGVTLPVELISFSAKKNNAYAELSWVTASETNNDHFTIEKSTDGVNYQSIGVVAGSGNSNTPIDYFFTDKDAGNLVNYYRLQQVDYDGASHYSKVVAVNMAFENSSTGSLTAGPNPFADFVNVNYNTITAGKIEIVLCDMTGKIVKNKTEEAEEGENTFLMDGMSNLPSGYYIIGISQNSSFSKLIKLVKSN